MTLNIKLHGIVKNKCTILTHQGTRTQCASEEQENSDDNVPNHQSHIHGFSLNPC